jgi:eukaryotic-like serine/threonine-protein kinase
MTPTQVDRRTFLKRLQASGLLEADELEAALKQLPPTNRGRVLARAMVERGLLTKFQAELILAGRTSGFQLGEYRILDQIGQGGMGRVYKALHMTMGREVALKVLAPQHVKTEKARQLFRREVRAAGRLSHPNIVTAYDASCADGRHYLAMEYVDGPNLEQLVRARGPLPIGVACEVVRQAALGLQYAFEQGMVHRDIKPSNLLVQRTAGGPFVVKILDFGLARLHERRPDGSRVHGTILAGQNVVMGTPDYLSPEQARSLHAVDIRSDLYSLGCTFYYLLTGEVPFPGGTSMEKLVRQYAEEPRPAEDHRPALLPDVGAIVRRLMAKDPARRFQTPAELALALIPFCTDGGGDWSGSRDTAEQGTAPVWSLDGSGPQDPGATPVAMAAETPLSLSEELPVLIRERDRERRRGLWKGLFLTAAALAALGGLISLAVLLNP